MTTPTPSERATMLTDDEINSIAAGPCWSEDGVDPWMFARAIERALLARLGEQQPVAWGIFDSQGFYEAALDKESADRFAAHYKDDPLKPYSAAPLYAHPSPAPVGAQERAEHRVLTRCFDEAVEMLSQILAHTKLGALEDQAARVLSRCRGHQAARSAAQGAVQVPAGWLDVQAFPPPVGVECWVRVKSRQGHCDGMTATFDGHQWSKPTWVGIPGVTQYHLLPLPAAPAHAGERQGDSA